VNFEDNYGVAIQFQPEMRPNRNERLAPFVPNQNPYRPIPYILLDAVQMSILLTLL